MMRIRVILMALALVVALALPGAAVAVKAAPVADNAAQYMPADTWLYASVRVDDEFISTLDRLINRIGEAIALVGGTIPPSPLRTALTLALAQGGFDLQTDIRPWLGQRIAFGVGNPALIGMTDSPAPEDVPAVLALDITDQAGADAFVTRVLSMANLGQAFKRSEGNQFISYDSQMPQQMPVNILITSDALLIGTQVGLAAARGDGTSLADSPRYADTLKLMPGDSYDVLFYGDYNVIFGRILAVMEEGGGRRPQMGAALDQMRNLVRAIGGMAIGLTVQEERTLILDVAQQIIDPEALLASADGLAALSRPIDPQFLALLPANTVAVGEVNGIATYYDQFMLAMKSQQALMNPELAAELERKMTRALGEFQAATGLDLNADVLAWMTGEAAAFVGYTPPAAGAPSALWSMATNDTPAAQNVDFGVMVKATDPAAARTVVERLGATIEERLQRRPSPRVSIVHEPVGGADAVVVRLDMPGLDAPFDLVLASNDQVLVFATRPAAEAILSGAGGFAQKPAFVAAQQYMLPDTVQLTYADTGLVDLFTDIVALQVVPSDQTILDDVAEHIFAGRPLNSLSKPDPAALAETRREYDRNITLARQIASVFASTSVSSRFVPESNGFMGRWVLSLGE